MASMSLMLISTCDMHLYLRMSPTTSTSLHLQGKHCTHCTHGFIFKKITIIFHSYRPVKTMNLLDVSLLLVKKLLPTSYTKSIVPKDEHEATLPT